MKALISWHLVIVDQSSHKGLMSMINTGSSNKPTDKTDCLLENHTLISGKFWSVQTHTHTHTNAILFSRLKTNVLSSFINIYEKTDFLHKLLTIY